MGCRLSSSSIEKSTLDVVVDVVDFASSIILSPAPPFSSSIWSSVSPRLIGGLPFFFQVQLENINKVDASSGVNVSSPV